MAGQVKVNQIQLGDSLTPTQNFVWQTNVDGTAKLARGNVGSTTQDILTVDANGKIAFPQGLGAGTTTAQSMVRVNTANGYGSTNTPIRRFTNVVTNQGTDITYADSATLGASFTINTAGIYSISFSDVFNGSANVGLSLNSTQLTTSIGSINTADRLAITAAAGADFQINVGWTGYLAAGSVVRAHNSAAPSGTIPAQTAFTITRVA